MCDKAGKKRRDRQIGAHSIRVGATGCTTGYKHPTATLAVLHADQATQRLLRT